MEWEKGRLLEKGNNVTLEKAAGMCGRRTVLGILAQYSGDLIRF